MFNKRYGMTGRRRVRRMSRWRYGLFIKAHTAVSTIAPRGVRNRSLGYVVALFEEAQGIGYVPLPEKVGEFMPNVHDREELHVVSILVEDVPVSKHVAKSIGGQAPRSVFACCVGHDHGLEASTWPSCALVHDAAISRMVPIATHRDADGVDPFVCEPGPVCLGDPGVPVTLQDLLRIVAFGNVEIALGRRSGVAEWRVRNPPL
ncbi:hypothetical protein NUW54_g12335 [Trametes sanguinea]|uniref:Uncharacterized protein n=1 Tax=Trametes sanguinea TaxID=158606 RepID=A0ACC1N115_9APHY|nr:hypothetical protein NUW54_g12335 [Trametes sanguinea]